MSDWTYGGAHDLYPCEAGEVWGTDLMRVAVHNIHDPLPAFMAEADVVVTDPPWNVGNCNAFVTKAKGDRYESEYEIFAGTLLGTIKAINPEVVWLEMGKEYLAWWLTALGREYPRVTFYNSTYYHKRDSLCYFIRATRRRRKDDISVPKLDGTDEEDIIAWVCEHEKYEVVGDPCMGRGLVGRHATRYGRRSVGTELNPNRLAVLLKTVKARKLA